MCLTSTVKAVARSVGYNDGVMQLLRSGVWGGLYIPIVPYKQLAVTGMLCGKLIRLFFG